ncbi:hypothetical protein BRADI_5g01781v3 [Brachypodium distachyon]|uniref:Uncharacterized protein n=1 Tax=Brachypodium distachyon TaxID=15368 RepID=A0A0Q3H0P4_BRADI|nr:hypothetical protein BRADI_5g01781v3 [Brachypodium distachyon]
MREVAVVSKSSPVVVVGADDRQSGSGTIDLSSFDKNILTLPVTLVLVFDHPIKDPSLAVGHYHPLAGRITGDGGGVSFVGASASCALDEYLSLLKDLAVDYPADWCRPTDPLVLMQVTEFSCGGFVFLRAVGEFARGVSPSVVPVRSSSLLPPSVVAAPRAMIAVASKEMASLDITIPSSLIARIKAEWDQEEDHEHLCTVFEAVTALLRRCRTRAVVAEDDEPAPLAFLSNLVQATSGAVKLVKLIKRAKERKPDQLLFKEDDGGGDRQPLIGWYNTLLVSSWRNLGFEAAEFGGGRPARVMWQQEQTVAPICLVCPPCKGKDGVNVMSLCVRPEHADAFQAALHAGPYLRVI